MPLQTHESLHLRGHGTKDERTDGELLSGLDGQVRVLVVVVRYIRLIMLKEVLVRRVGGRG